MAKKTLTEVFEIEKEEFGRRILTDYEVFEDKEMLDNIRNIIIQKIIDDNIPDDRLLNQHINEEVESILSAYKLSSLEKDHIINLVDNEINGYGPITELLDDDNITEIMVNGINEIYVEIDGKVIKDETISFINNDHILRTIQKIIAPVGRMIDASNPMVDARLNDGSRLNAIIPPLSINGPVMTIRKFKSNMNDVEDFLRNGTLTSDMARFLEAAVLSKLNIIICGGTGSGKTSILNMLSSFLGEDERIITIEDAAELNLNQKHVISLETRNMNYEGTGEVTIRDLVRNSLRMRPDRIIVGEVRGKEAFDMLQAMNTGHEGSLTTMHANSSSDAINRLESMIMMTGIKMPLKAIRQYITDAIDLVINVSRLSDGRRKIVNISEVVELDKDDNIVLNDIFTFNPKGLTSNNEVDGEFSKVKKAPKIYKKMKTRENLDIEDIFK